MVLQEKQDHRENLDPLDLWEQKVNWVPLESKDLLVQVESQENQGSVDLLAETDPREK